MKKIILVLLVFIVGFIIGQATHIYTYSQGLRINTITGDIVRAGEILQKKENNKKYNKIDLSGLDLEKEQ